MRNRPYLLLFLLVFPGAVMSQGVVYDYDNAGNRIVRKIKVALPVNLVIFTADKPEESTQYSDLEWSGLLNWVTASEMNCERFEVERSIDHKNWLTIGMVPAIGGSEKRNYVFTDSTPMNDENLYRLKIIDKDGSFAYSRLVSLNFASGIILYPNPVQDLLQIRGLLSSERIVVTDRSGKIVYSGISTSEGIRMGSLEAGVYLVSIFHKDGSLTTRKIIKE